jgi:hypothetical protein
MGDKLNLLVNAKLDILDYVVATVSTQIRVLKLMVVPCWSSCENLSVRVLVAIRFMTLGEANLPWSRFALVLTHNSNPFVNVIGVPLRRFDLVRLSRC